MRILNIQIENFRNIIKADVNFSKINVLTGKNSSGKTNFLLAISKCISTNTDLSDAFFDNIVTFGPGKRYAQFKTTVEDDISGYLYRTKDKESIIIEPKEFVFENKISKKTLSPTHHSLLFTGSYVKDSSTDDESWQNLLKKGKKSDLVDSLVYEKDFTPIRIESTNDKQVVEKNEGNNHEDAEKFLSIFSNYERKLYSWVHSKNFSSTAIHNHVVERIENGEIYDQVVNYLKNKKVEKTYSKAPFARAKFIQILADVQKQPKQRVSFKKDLKLYTEGLLTDLYINAEGNFGVKGEIHVQSKNGPKDIFYLSAGTAVMIYFILLKNWCELSITDRSFEQPTVMIFDEIDSIIHPSLMANFTEVIKSLSNYIQLFISTHSPHFIDCFNKDQLFWLTDITTTSNKKKNAQVSVVYSYNDILKKLPKNDYFLERSNSELFVNGLMDSLFPLI